MKQTIAAIIPAFNEEANIERCVKSVLWCDKVLVLWMGNDKTGAIAKTLGAKVIELNKNIKPDFTSVQKNINWAIDNATTDWILRIDADEEVTPELQTEISGILNLKFEIFNKGKKATGGSCERDPDPTSPRLNQGFEGQSSADGLDHRSFSKGGKETTDRICCEDYVAFGLPRNQYFLGAFLKGGDWYYDRLVRLFRPKFARYEPIVPIHEQFKVVGKIGYLENRLNHFSHPTFKDVVKKFQLYTDAEVSQMKDSFGLAFLKMIFLPLYVFLRWFFWHNGYRDGWRGIIAGMLRGWYEFLRFRKFIFHTAKI